MFIEEQQGSRGNGGLEKEICCYESKGQQLAQSPRRDSSQTCDRSNATYQAVLAWQATSLSAPNANRRSGGSPAPAPVPITAVPPTNSSSSPNITVGEGILIAGVAIVGTCVTALAVTNVFVPGADEAATATIAIIGGIAAD